MAAELRSTAGSVRRAGGSHARHGGIGLAEMQRARLLAAALQVVDELGCEGASVLSITAKAGVARLCVVGSLQAGTVLLARRQEVLRRLARVVAEGANESARAGNGTALIAEGLVGAVTAILYERLTGEKRKSLASLHGELMAMIVLPYLGAQAARRERVRSAPRLDALAVHAKRQEGVNATPPGLLARLPMRLTYRTARVLSDLAEHPRSNNREIATRVGVRDQGQISRLLARLQGLGLIANAASGAAAKGEPNVWSLTAIGEQVMYTIGAGQGAGRTARCGE